MLGHKKATLAALVAVLATTGTALASSGTPETAVMPTSGVNQRTTQAEAWAALRLLAVVANRAQAETAIIGAALGHLDREGFHSLVTEMKFLNADPDQPFPRTVPIPPTQCTPKPKQLKS